MENDMSLTSEECRRFQEIIEREIADDLARSEVNQAFIQRHGAECDECASFLEMIDALQDFDDDLAIDDDSVIRDIVSRRFDAKWRQRIVRMAIAASALLIMGGAFVWHLSTRETTHEDVQFELAEGELQIVNQVIGRGQRFAFNDNIAVRVEKDALFQTHNALFVAAETDSDMRIVEATPTSVTLKLEKGRLALHLVPKSGIRLSVELPNGVVEVTGTVFIVEADQNRSSVSVIRGSVAVREKGHERAGAKKVTGGMSYSLANHAVSERIKNPGDQLLALLGIPDAPEIAIAEPEVSEPAEQPVDDPPGSEKPPRPVDKPSLESLIQAASTCRAQRNWECAVKNYESIIRRYPNRPDATTAMLPAAQILLDNMGRPSRALKYYRRYQKSRPRGGLGQEALWGECNALKKLNQTDQETNCLRRYLKRYPAATFSSEAESRLNNILSN